MQKGQTANAEAYRLYLKGRFLWNKHNPKDLSQAAVFFEQAIALDSNYALAYAGLGDVYTVDFFHVGNKLADFEKENEATEISEEKKQQKETELKEIKEAFEKSGAQGYWRKWLEIEKRSSPAEADFNLTAILYANLGEKKNALGALEKAIEEKNSDVALMKVEPFFDSLQSEPRFQTLLRRIGLTP